jgi:membrane protein YdbS with pleckstrin-like domain
MKFPITIRQSPLILVKRIIELEIIFSVFLFIISLLTNFEELFKETIGHVYGRYDVFLFLFASAVQIFITLVVFFFWQNEEYRVKEKEVSLRKGIFSTKERSILLKNVTSVEYKRSPLEILLSYGTIVIHSNGEKKPFYIRSIETPEIYSNIIKDAVDRALYRKPDSAKRHSILDMVLEGENTHLELKQTFRYDVKTKDVNKALEKSVLKTITAFLNSDGGNLIVGVTDRGEIYGLEEDYKTLVRKDRDGFENHFNQVIKTMIGAGFRQYIEISFEKIEDKDICLIEVMPSQKPVYLKVNGDEDFFIRTGNTTSPLKVSEVASYIESRWEK